jgi:MoxR-like ATPase
MKFPFYKGDGFRSPNRSPQDLPFSRRSQLLKPEHYIADLGLRDACNVALLLGQPLLLTGEAGTGKTQFAYSLAWELGFEPPLKFETKSNSTARDLFYNYDALKRFQDAQSGDWQFYALKILAKCKNFFRQIFNFLVRLVLLS